MAKRLNIPPIVIGLTIVAFGTSTPELVVSVSSALKGSADIAIGNVVGSNIFNTLMIVGCTAMFAPIVVTRNTLRKEIPLCILASVVMLICANDIFLDKASKNVLNRADGLLLLCFFAIFVGYTFAIAFKPAAAGEAIEHPAAEEGTEIKSFPWWKSILYILGGLGALGAVVIVIVFQPEIRGILTRIGQVANVFSIKTIFFRPSGLDEITEKIVEAVLELQKKAHGALIVLEKRVGLKSYMDSGEIVNSDFSKKLLCTIFYPGTPLHDGAVIILRDKILAAGCVLPMPTGAAAAEQSGGMRHRAAKALAAETDAFVIVVSEETGYISIAYRDSFRTRQSKRELEEEIKRHWRELYED